MSEENNGTTVRRRRSGRRDEPDEELQAVAGAQNAENEQREEPTQYGVGNLNRGNARFGEGQRMTASQPQVVLPPQYDPYMSVTGSQPWAVTEQNQDQVPWASGAQPVYGWQNQFRYGTQPTAPVYPQGQAPEIPKKQRKKPKPDRDQTRGQEPLQGRYPAQGPYPNQYPGQYPNQGAYPNQVQYQNQYANQAQAPNQGTAPDREPEPKKKSRLGIILGAVVGGVILTVLLCVFFFKVLPEQRQARAEEEYRVYVESQVTPYNDRYCPGVSVDGIDLGGKTQAEARELVTEAAMINNTWRVQLIWQGEVYTTLTEADLGITVDVETALAEAWRQGHEGDTEARWQAMQALLTEEGAYSGSSVTDSGDRSAFEEGLKQLSDSLYVAPTDAKFLGFDPYRTDPMIFQAEVPGRHLDVDGIREEALRMAHEGRSGSIELQATELMPAVTAASLRAERYSLRGSASTPISPTHSTEERNNNIRRAFDLITGTVIQPGQSFDFNKIVGKRTQENGFFPADEYVYGEHQEGTGGGVCQACTTIYQAAVRANMRIDKRTPHSLAVNYTPYGKDATVYWWEGKGGQKIDFIFTNTSEYPVYIKAAVQSAEKNKKNLVCNVWIYGAGLGEGVSYDIETEEIVIPAPEEPKLVRDRNAEYVTYEDEQYQYRKPENGTEVRRWLVKYVNKKEVERTQLETDMYPAKEEIIYVGTKKRPT